MVISDVTLFFIHCVCTDLCQATALAGKLEEADQQLSVLQRRIRELEAKVEELEEDLATEKAARAKVEKQRDDFGSSSRETDFFRT